eukprot:gene15165-16724_t
MAFTSRHKNITFYKQMQKYTWYFVFLQLTIACLSAADISDQFCSCSRFAYPNKPFTAIWNSPTGGCKVNFSVPINLQPWQILSDSNQYWNSRFVTVFYGAQLGLYPYYLSEDGDSNFNGGLPQLVNLRQHLEKSKMDIASRIPDPDYNGLAVIDWEPWRPLWERNWNSKKIYKIKSVDLVREKHPDWSMTDLVLEAKDEFEAAARAMMVETIRLGKRLRPNALWGFYGFPDCFGQEKYDFQCTNEVKRSNDKIDWIFTESTALFPSIYLLKNHLENPDYVKGRLREAFRVGLRLSQRFGKQLLPVFPYFRSIYMDDPLQFNFLDRNDLYNTIGVASEMGASGVVIWGNRNDENTSPDICHRINNYIQNTLGPTINDVRNKVEKCSKGLCFGVGRCVRKAHLDGDLRRLYSHRHYLSSNCAQTKLEDAKKRTLSVPNLKQNGSRKAPIVNASLTKYNILKQAPSANEKLNKLQIELHGKLEAKPEISNSSKKLMNQKSEVPFPEKRFPGSFISNHVRHSKASLLPHMYVLIVGVAIAGAFLFSLIFVALYYYLNINQTQKGTNAKQEVVVAKDMERGGTGPRIYKETEESDYEVDLDSLKSFERQSFGANR